MKKNTFAFVFLMIVSLCGAQTINFPDPNFKARLLAASPGLQIASGTGSIPGNPFVKIDANNDGEIQVSEALAITNLWLYNANITNVSGLEYFTNLSELNCYGNSIPTMDLSPLTQLTRVTISNNHITTLNVTGLSNIEWLNCPFNDLTSLDLTGMTSMYQLQCQNNQLTSLNISNANNLSYVSCQNNLLTTFDANSLTDLVTFNCASNNLESLYLKNNTDEISFLSDFSNNPNLKYICADDFQLATVQNKINLYGYNNCYTNSTCSFIPGNPVYFVQGITKYDEMNDGCDVADLSYPNLKLILSDGNATGYVYSSNNGSYNTGSQNTTISITPELENPSYFSITPSSQTVSLTSTSAPFVQNFCVTPNGSHPDLEISMERTNQGFDAYNYYYLLTYKNIGTHTQSGNVSLAFDDNQQDFQISTPAVTTSLTNLLTWDFSDLKPFETRTIQITFHMNLGTTLNGGEILHYEATVSSVAVDETPNNNMFVLDEVYQTAVLNTPNLSFSDYFALYPNPTQNVLNIKVKNDILVNDIKVYSLLGQTVQQFKAIPNESVIDVSALSKGTYLIKIITDRGIFNSKFVKN